MSVQNTAKVSYPCTQCHHPLETETILYCQGCGALQPVQTRSAFACFDLPMEFSLEKTTLEKKYFDLQKKLHPDHFIHKSSQEKMLALQHSATINEAYLTLKDPVKRAFHMLELELGASVVASCNDPEMLMEIMSLQEALASDSSQKETLEKIEGLWEENFSRLSQALEIKDFQPALLFAHKLRYLQKLRQEARG